MFQFMESGENIDQLYMLFSDLLDRKLSELNTKSALKEDKKGQDDIQDDYMAQVVSSLERNQEEGHLLQGSRSSLSGMNRSSEQLSSEAVVRRGRRQSTGDLKIKNDGFNV